MNGHGPGRVDPSPRRAGSLGWHYLSNATCLIVPPLFSTALLTCLMRLIDLFSAIHHV